MASTGLLLLHCMHFNKFTIQGKLVKTVTLTGTFNEVEVSTQELPAVTYLLSYKRNGKVESSVKVAKE